MTVSATGTISSHGSIAREACSYARGFALAEIAGFTLEDATTSDGEPRANELDSDEFPEIVRAAQELVHGDRDTAFFLGATALLDGLIARRS